MNTKQHPNLKFFDRASPEPRVFLVKATLGKEGNKMKRDSRGNNCNVLGTSAEEATHVKHQTPMQTKRTEIMSDPMYRTDLDAGFDTTRQKSTTKARRSGNTRPLGGGAAQK